MKGPSTQINYYSTRWLFLRALAIVYFFAFASLSTQIIGLVGKQGILPATNFLSRIAEQLQMQAGVHAAPLQVLPTLFWCNSSDWALSAVCVAGVVFSALAFFGAVSVFSFVMLWLLYLSLVNIGQDFLSFQWDILLLETGFLGIFLAPWQWMEAPWKINGKQFSWSAATVKPPTIIIWLLRLLLFRLMFESGFVKLASGDPAWHNLTALNYHYFTQPLPTPIAWYAALLPGWFSQFSVLMVFAVELLTPFLIFAGRTGRFIAAFAFIQFQILIAFTGNYAFFNLLTVALCICLLDDDQGRTFVRFLYYCIGKIRIPIVSHGLNKSRPYASISYPDSVNLKLLPLPKVQYVVSILVAILVGVLSVCATARGTFGAAMPDCVEKLFEISERYFICNSYGLFAVMTTKRLEIQIEGSNDGVFWDEYEFKYKPGNLDKAPSVVAPGQPRLDWQMWFAALSDFRNNPWFLNLAFRLLQGEPTVLKLLANNPFPKGPPQYIRARLYDYHFTNENERHKTGNWWKRELVGDYLPPISMQPKNP